MGTTARPSTEGARSKAVINSAGQNRLGRSLLRDPSDEEQLRIHVYQLKPQVLPTLPMRPETGSARTAVSRIGHPQKSRDYATRLRKPSRETLFSKGDSKIGCMLGAKLIEEELLESGIEERDLD